MSGVTMRSWKTGPVALVLATLVGTATACGGTEPAPTTIPSTPVAAPQPSPAPDPVCRPGVHRLGNAEVAYAATVRRPTTAYAAPGGRPLTRFGLRNVNGVRTVLGVLAVRRNANCTRTWIRAQLPMRPNGAVGWVRARDVVVRPVATRIEIDLSERRVVLFRRGQEVLDVRAAIGAPDTPTPTGRYYVNQRLRAPDPTGPFGPGAVGISAFSPTLQDWVQGGPIAIHGTNAPHRIGLAVSHGCLRIANAQLLRLYEQAPEGTPVTIRA